MKESIEIMRKYEIWLADLDPGMGTEPGKVRPVLIIQSDFLNEIHTSTMICPITSQVKSTNFLRININFKASGLLKSSDALLDQIRAIDNSRLNNKLGELPKELHKKVDDYLKIVLDLEN